MPLAHYLRTYIFLIPLIVGLLSEFTKYLVESFRSGDFHTHIFHTGGFPSSHSAFVTSLLIVVARKAGYDSVEFAIAFVFACIVWYDAMSSRKAIGDQATILNRLQQWKHLTERLGHSFTEVIGGIVFGAAVTWLGIWLSVH